MLAKLAMTLLRELCLAMTTFQCRTMMLCVMSTRITTTDEKLALSRSFFSRCYTLRHTAQLYIVIDLRRVALTSQQAVIG